MLPTVLAKQEKKQTPDGRLETRENRSRFRWRDLQPEQSRAAQPIAIHFVWHRPHVLRMLPQASNSDDDDSRSCSCSTSPPPLCCRCLSIKNKAKWGETSASCKLQWPAAKWKKSPPIAEILAGELLPGCRMQLTAKAGSKLGYNGVHHSHHLQHLHHQQQQQTMCLLLQQQSDSVQMISTLFVNIYEFLMTKRARTEIILQVRASENPLK